MPRPRTIPDADIFAAIRQLLADGGDKAVAFGPVARATGLAAPTLVQRYGTRDGMIRAALMAAWDDLDTRTAAAEAEAGTGPKGAVALLKALGGRGDSAEPVDVALLAVDFRDAALRDRATAWRARVEGALALRLGGGAKGQAAAAMLFAAWQGQALWALAGGKTFRLKDAAKRLA
jgi:hypothetical protein